MKLARSFLGFLYVSLCLIAGCDHCRDSLPSGSYAASCEDCSIDCTVLSCSCGNGHGEYLDTELDVSTCKPGEEISNDHGDLKCGEPACMSNGIACGPSDTFIDACCSGYCGSHGTCE